MENVNTTSTFENPYLPENLVTHFSFFSRIMLEAANIHSAEQFRAEMDRLVDQPFHQNTVFLHPIQMEILRQDIERDAAPSWHNSVYNQSIPPMEIPLARMKRTEIYNNIRDERRVISTELPRIRSYENNRDCDITTIATLFEKGLDLRGPCGSQTNLPNILRNPESISFSSELVNEHTEEINVEPIAEQLISYTISREPTPIFTIPPNPEILRGVTANRIIIHDPEEEVQTPYIPYRNRRTGNQPKPTQVLLNDIKNYLQAYHDGIVDAETTLGALNGIYTLVISLYGHDTFFQWHSRTTSMNTWSIKDRELIIHEANFATFCQWLHKQQ